jgi:predicted Fe-Mo cluster-binding NifX family protein
MSGEINSTKENNFSGKIAIATNDGARVTGHIGRCKSFMIYQLEGDKIINKELRENVFTHHRMHQGHQHHGESGGHNHTQLINGLKDCSYLISSGGGWRVVEDLKKNNIIPVFSDIDSLEEALNQFIKGELKDDAGLICNHNEH